MTSYGSNYYVKLVERLTGQDVVGVYVLGGQRLEVDVPLGSYELRYASGQVWYGFDTLFGPSTGYFRADEVFTFNVVGNRYSGYTVQLIQQVNGNLETSPISPSQF